MSELLDIARDMEKILVDVGAMNEITIRQIDAWLCLPSGTSQPRMSGEYARARK